jgi:hypothetical protein
LTEVFLPVIVDSLSQFVGQIVRCTRCGQAGVVAVVDPPESIAGERILMVWCHKCLLELFQLVQSGYVVVPDENALRDFREMMNQMFLAYQRYLSA